VVADAIAQRVHEEGLCLPSGAGIGQAEIAMIAQVIADHDVCSH
jgi:hypothetical protein